MQSGKNCVILWYGSIVVREWVLANPLLIFEKKIFDQPSFIDTEVKHEKKQ